jgi:hypothetical protein
VLLLVSVFVINQIAGRISPSSSDITYDGM